MKEELRKQYELWCKKATADADVQKELLAIANDEEKIEDAFYRNLAFGTGGLRGVIGAGTNRMNIYTVAKASQGLADYVNANYPEGKRKIAVSYDSRIKSDLFARVSSGVFAANACKAQAMFIRKYGKEKFFRAHDKLHEKYDFKKTQEVLGTSVEEGLKILEECSHV